MDIKMDKRILAFEVSKHSISVIGVALVMLFIAIIVNKIYFPKEKYFTINGVECVQVSKGIFCNCNK